MEIIEFEEINPITYKVRIRIEVAALTAEFEKALANLAKKAEVPGFRPGKAPGKVVERHVGSMEIWRIARDAASYEAFSSALRMKKMSALAEPDFEHAEYRGEGDYEFSVTFHTEPPSPQELIRRATEQDTRMIHPEDHLPEGFMTNPAITSPEIPGTGTYPGLQPDGISDLPDAPSHCIDSLPGSPSLHPKLPSAARNIIRQPGGQIIDDKDFPRPPAEKVRDPEDIIPERLKKPTRSDYDHNGDGED